MKHFYINNGDLYSSEVPIVCSAFSEISKEDYEEKLSELKAKRVTGVPVTSWDDWDQENAASDRDYIDALQSLGVEFGE